MKRALVLVPVVVVLLAACGSSKPGANSAAIPPGSGFSCLDKGEIATLCFRDEPLCRAVNDEGKGVCRPVTTAHCFTFQREGKEEFACLTEPGQCQGFSDFLKKKSEIANVSPCAPQG